MPVLEKIAGLQIHPAASMFPLMPEADLAKLAEDIKARGLDHPVVMHEGKVLDGRNRLRACEIAGVQPRTAPWDCRGGSVVGYVVSANIHRRHLNESQRALLAAELLPMYEKEAKGRLRTNTKKEEQLPLAGAYDDAAKCLCAHAFKRHNTAGLCQDCVCEVFEPADGVAPRGATQPDEPTPEPVKAKAKGKAVEFAAKDVGAAPRSVERAKAVLRAAPEALVEKVRAGKATLKQVEKQIRKAEQIEKVRAYVAPEGEFPCIVADPSWPFEDELDGSDEARGGLPYPPQTVEEICAKPPPSAKDCILFLWTTSTHLLTGDAQTVVKAWGFTGKTILTWKKNRMTRGNYLRNITEHVIVAVKGKPVLNLTNQTTFIEAPIGGHSEKPQAFYDLVACLVPARPLLELNARKPRPGWVTSGAELPEQASPEKSPALAITCPDCKAKKDKHCRTGTGKARPLPHVSRVNAALKLSTKEDA